MKPVLKIKFKKFNSKKNLRKSKKIKWQIQMT
jgi:hypothetical protein